MPRQPILCVDKIFESLKDLNFFNEENHVVRLSDPVWRTAERILNGKLSVKYLYLYFSQNRNKILERFKEKHSIPINKNSSLDSADTSNRSNSSINDSNTSNWSMSSPCRLKPWRTIVYVDSVIWQELFHYGFQHESSNKSEIGKPGWTDVIYNEIWTQLKLPCCFAFKSAKINCNPGDIFLKIKGRCSECGALFNAYSMEQPDNAKAKMAVHVSTYDTRDIMHTKKRHLRKVERNRIIKDLRATSAYAWRRQKANEIMSFGDVEPAHLYSETVLRKAKQIDNDERLNLGKVSDPIHSILQLKYKPEFAGTIREIGLDKFFVIYFSPEQLFLYQRYNRKIDKTGMLSIDATGSLIRNIKKPDGSMQFLYLYQAVIPFKGKILPVLQMVSEKHDTNILSYWLREWLRCGGSCPKEVVIDYSFALLNAVALSFNNCDLNTYVENCMIVLQDTNYTNIPKCIIRIDIAHLIKMVCRWKCFQNTHPRVKDFFVRCIGILSTTTTFANFKQICLDILIVAFSEMEDINNPDDNILTCFNAQQRLLSMIKTQEMQYEDIRGECEDDVLDDEYENNRINTLLHTIEAESKKLINTGNRPNPYYCYNFGTNLLRICKQFPLWTAVMKPNELTSASSARSEEYFNELKNLIFASKRNIRIDKFLVSHIRSLAGTVKILNAMTNNETVTSTVDINQADISQSDQNLNECLTDDTNKYHQTDIPSDSAAKNVSNIKDQRDPEHITDQTTALNEKEIWKGRKNKKLNRSKYLRVCPDIVSIHNKPNITSKVPLLQNGNMLRPQNVSGQYCMLNNTCAFDSIIQSLLVAYRDRTTYYEYINNIPKHNVFDFIKMISASGISEKIYKERAIILGNIFKPLNGRITCTSNIGYLLEKHLLQDIPSYEISEHCSICEWVNQEKTALIQINTKPIYKQGIHGLQNALTDKTQNDNRKCKRCSNNIASTFTPGMHLFIDIECLQWTELAQRLGHNDWIGTFTLSELPHILEFCNVSYKLAAAIEYIGGQNKNEVGHYVAHCFRIPGNWETYDDISHHKNRIAPKDRTSEKKQISILFYVKQ